MHETVKLRVPPSLTQFKTCNFSGDSWLKGLYLYGTMKVVSFRTQGWLPVSLNLFYLDGRSLSSARLGKGGLESPCSTPEVFKIY